VAQAGYRVVALDVRGYGGSDKPHAVEAYDMASLMADVLGVIDAFGEQTAILVGHDWGAPICRNTAALHADRVAAVAGLSVPYRRRGKTSSIELWRRIYQDRFFYQLYFQAEGVAEAELEADVRTLRKFYYAASGEAASLDSWLQRPAGGTLLEGLPDPKGLPAWLTSEDLDYFVAGFEAGGFRGPINRYRNQERDFANLPEMGIRRACAGGGCPCIGASSALRERDRHPCVVDRRPDRRGGDRRGRVVEWPARSACATAVDRGHAVQGPDRGCGRNLSHRGLGVRRDDRAVATA